MLSSAAMCSRAAICADEPIANISGSPTSPSCSCTKGSYVSGDLDAQGVFEHELRVDRLAGARLQLHHRQSTPHRRKGRARRRRRRQAIRPRRQSFGDEGR